MTSGKCGDCKTYDRIKKCCKLEPFEGQYDDECPKYEEFTMGIIGLTLGLIVTGILWAVHIALGIIAFWGVAIVAILIGTKTVKAFGVILLLVSTVSCMSWYAEVKEQPVVEQPAIERTPGVEAVQPSPTMKSIPVDPFKISAPVSNFEEWQANAACGMSVLLHWQEGWETGVIILSKKNGHGYATHVWAKSRGTTYVSIPLADDDFLSMTKEDHARKYDGYHINYVSHQRGHEWVGEMSIVWHPYNYSTVITEYERRLQQGPNVIWVGSESPYEEWTCGILRFQTETYPKGAYLVWTKEVGEIRVHIRPGLFMTVEQLDEENIIYEFLMEDDICTCEPEKWRK